MFERVKLGARVRAALNDPSNRQVFANVVPIYLLHRAALVLVVFCATQLVPMSYGWHALPELAIFDPWLRFDSQYYLQIAAVGYRSPEFVTSTSFFPFYPWLVRAVAAVMPLPLAALLVANVAAMAALCLLFALVRRIDGIASARRALVVALLFPTSYFFTAAYSESTYVALALGATLCWLDKRHVLGAACVIAATLTRPIGAVCLSLPFLIGWLVQRRKFSELPWFTLGAPIGAGALLVTFRIATGEWLSFLTSSNVTNMRIFWDEPNPPPFWAVLAEEGLGPNLMRRLLNWSAMALVLAVTAYLLKRRDIEFALLSFCSILIPFFFHGSVLDAASMARYALCAFPVFVVLARWLPDGTPARMYDCFAQMLQTLLAVLFATWRWVE
jgi:hypothetical protein